MRTKTMHNEWIRLVSAGGLLGLAAIAPTQGLVTGLSKQEIGSGVQLTIEGKDLPTPRELRVMSGKAYILEFDAKLKGGAKNLDIDSAGVTGAKVVWYKSKPPVVRVLVWLKPDEKPVLATCADGYTLSINMPVVAAPSNQEAPQKPKVAPKLDPMVRQPMPVDASKAKETKDAAAAAQKVSLDFVNTDVIQILKALALQADVNIITAPEVQGRKITVSLDKVTVGDALDFVTALAGLRYARVQNSYVVTTKDTFAETLRTLANKSDQQNVIRLVPIISGDGAGIKRALTQWFGPTTLQVLLPGEQDQKISAATPPAAGGAPAAGQAGAAPAGAQTGAPQAAPQGQAPQPQAATAPGAAKDTEDTPYFMLIGEQKWVSQAETMMHRSTRRRDQRQGTARQCGADGEARRGRAEKPVHAAAMEKGQAGAIPRQRTWCRMASPTNSKR